LSDDVVRLSVIGQILRRRWRFLLALAALGAVVGATASLLWPPAYESSSRVLLQGDLDKDRVLSEAQIAMSLVVLDRAATGLNWGVEGPGLRDWVSAAVADGHVIEIKAKADSPDRARQLAERVTQHYIAFSTEILTKSAIASGEVLAPRKDSLQQQVADMNRRISELQGSVGQLNAANAQGAAASAELQRLSSDRTEAAKELNELEGRIAKAQAAASRENFSVIEPPVAPPAPATLTRLQMVAGGAALAAGLGAMVLVVVRQTDRRLRRGSDIAAALGAPILGTVEASAEATVRSPTNGSSNGNDAAGKRSLLQHLLHNGVPWITASGDQSLEYLRYQRVLARLRTAPEESVRLLIIVVNDDLVASRAVGQLAIAATLDGRPVSVLTSSRQLAETVQTSLTAGNPGPAPINVDVSTSANQSGSSQAVVLSVVPVSATRPIVPDSHGVSGALVVVTSGTRTAGELLAVAEACDDAGHPVAGVLMVLPRADEDEAEDANPEQLRRSIMVGPPRGQRSGVTGKDSTSMAEPLLDLEHLVAGIRWRRHVWTSFALVGLFAGVLLSVVFPPRPTAVTRVLVAHADDQQADRSVLMATDLALCQTSGVAAAALKQIKVIERPEIFLATYSCASVTPNVLAITASGTNDGDAMRRAQALADVVIANHVKRTQDAVDAQVKPLLDRRARLEGDLAQVTDKISSTTALAPLDALFTARAGLASQITDLSRQAEDAGIGVPTVIAGTRLVDPPRALPIRLIRTGITNTVVGLVLGLGTGLAVAAVLCVTRDRPVRRRDIAAELGVSIIAQLSSPPRGPRRLWRRSRHVRERQRVVATLARVARGAHTSISLLEIGCPGTAAALALDIAEQIAPERPVVVVADLSREFLREAAEKSGSAARIVDVADLPLGQSSPVQRPELSLGVGSVGPGTSWLDVGRLGAETLLVVRAGHATTLGLHTIARQLAHSEISAIGVVLVAPDPRDRSDGTLWDGLHTALRGRYATAGSPLMHQGRRRPAPSSNGQPVLAPSAAPDEK
jgi:uncharacterized protein involved in exopolysaccharide biosynthesis